MALNEGAPTSNRISEMAGCGDSSLFHSGSPALRSAFAYLSANSFVLYG